MRTKTVAVAMTQEKTQRVSNLIPSKLKFLFEWLVKEGLRMSKHLIYCTRSQLNVIDKGFPVFDISKAALEKECMSTIVQCSTCVIMEPTFSNASRTPSTTPPRALTSITGRDKCSMTNLEIKSFCRQLG